MLSRSLSGSLRRLQALSWPSCSVLRRQDLRRAVVRRYRAMEGRITLMRPPSVKGK